MLKRIKRKEVEQLKIQYSTKVKATWKKKRVRKERKRKRGEEDNEDEPDEKVRREMNQIKRMLNYMGLEKEVTEWILHGSEKNERNVQMAKKLRKQCERMILYGSHAGQVKQHITELYSPPRVNRMVERMGLILGLSLDLTTVDPEDGMPWDFNSPEKRIAAKRLIMAGTALLLIVRPMGAAFNCLQNLNFCKKNKEEVERIIAYEMRHLECCMELCEVQMNNGLHFLFEHPSTASSWKKEAVQRIMRRPGVGIIVGHMCCFGMKQRHEDKEWMVKKPTGFLTNCRGITQNRNKKCEGKHRHISLINDRATMAEIYPDDLCREILLGLMRQMEVDAMMESGEINMMAKEEKNVMEVDGKYGDSISGKELSPELIKNGRKEEMEEVRKHDLYTKVPINECWDETGCEPIGTKWAGVNKVDENKPEFRCRFVAQEINWNGISEWFAATPSLEALKLIISLSMCTGFVKGHGENKTEYIDVRRAYFHAPAVRTVYIKFPKEDEEEGLCGRLNMSMYGTRDAAQNWERAYVTFMEKCGFRRGVAHPCVFYHESVQVWCVIHGDDFTVMGKDAGLDWFRERIRKEWEVKIKVRLGPEESDDKSVRVLNRIVEHHGGEVTIEADQRHVEIIVNELDLKDDTKGAAKPGVKEKLKDDANNLEGHWASKYRQ